MKLDIKAKVDLSHYGELWKDCYLEFKILPYPEVKKILAKKKDNLTDEEGTRILDEGFSQLEELFVDGYVISEGQKVQVKKDDIKDFPLGLLLQCYQKVQGEPDPKLLSGSTPS